jgi:hypothetical protein
MPVMLSKTYDALIAAGAPEEKARDAAEEIAAYENRLAKIETDLALIRAELGEIHRTMATKAWMLAQMFVLLGGVAALMRLLH